MLDADILGKDCLLYFRQGAVIVIIVVLGWRGREWRFGCTCKFDMGLFGVVGNSADLGHGGGNTVKGPVFEGIN